jgi:hypothetical protein
VNEYMRHFPKKFSKEMQDFATDEVFLNSRYLFYWREGKHKVGYCTHCRTTSGISTDYTHNDTGFCPSCHSACTIKSAGRGRGKLIDNAFFVFYEKSILDPNVIVALAVDAYRDYRGGYRDVDTHYNLTALYYFEMDNSKMFNQDYCYHKRKYDYVEQKTVFSLLSRRQNNYWRIKRELYCSRDSIKKAVAGTPFQYSCWEKYSSNDTDMIKFFDLYSRYPCIEYLTKLEMYDLVKAKLDNYYTYGTVNWRGKTLQKVLRLPKEAINEIKKAKIHVDPLFLKLLQLSIKDGSNLPAGSVSTIRYDYQHYFRELEKVLVYGSLRKITNFFNKQYTTKNNKHYRTKSEVLTTWRDYIADCKKLELDLRDESILFPSNLYEAHQRTIVQISAKEDKALNEKISKRIEKSLNKYCFEDSGLLIRPAESSMELIIEGKTLHHCVGGYAQSYAEGKTDILLIRKTDSPDTPYFTVEIWRGNLSQVRGNKNCQPGPDVDEFIKKFTEAKLTKKKSKLAVSA